ncbi:hypothetical protein D3C72_2070480 [compost metagenome]
MREPLFYELDGKVSAAQRALRSANRADDPGAIDDAEATLEALDAYGQALADITEPPNTPDNVTWPTRPW